MGLGVIEVECANLNLTFTWCITFSQLRLLQ